MSESMKNMAYCVIDKGRDCDENAMLVFASTETEAMTTAAREFERGEDEFDFLLVKRKPEADRFIDTEKKTPYVCWDEEAMLAAGVIPSWFGMCCQCGDYTDQTDGAGEPYCGCASEGETT